MKELDTVVQYTDNILATIIGVVLVLGSGAALYFELLPVLVFILVLLLGLFLMFPQRVERYIKLIGDKIPSFGSK